MHLGKLRLFLSDDLQTEPLLASKTEDVCPLQKLEKLAVASLSPWLWAHLSRLGVKLTEVELGDGYALDIFETHDPTGRVLNHVLNVISDPRLQRFRFFASSGIIPPLIKAAVFAHPRRSVSVSFLRTDAGIDPKSMSLMEELSLNQCSDHALRHVLSQPLPRLRRLDLTNFCCDDRFLATVILAVNQTIESLELIGWRHPGIISAVQTVTAIGTAVSLHSHTARAFCTLR
jgi:hypothetical protein